MQSLLVNNSDKIASICSAHHISHLAAFGSAVRDDFDPESSDVDLIYEFSPEVTRGYARLLLSLSNELEKLFERSVDLIEIKYVRNPYLLRSILEDQKTLYAA